MSHPEALEIVSRLLEEHALLRRTISRIENDFGKSEEIKALLTQLSHHHEAEEAALFPRLAEENGFQVRAFAFLERHELLRELLLKIERSVNEEQLRSRLLVFFDFLRLCLEKEEAELLPILRSSCSKEERLELGLRYREIKADSELALIYRSPREVSLEIKQAGRVNLFIPWLIGVPLWFLLLILLVWGG